MKKNIDLPDEIRWELEALALQEKKDLNPGSVIKKE